MINHTVLEGFHETLIDKATEEFTRVHYPLTRGDHLVTNGFTVEGDLVTFDFYEVTPHDMPYSITLEYYLHEIPNYTPLEEVTKIDFEAKLREAFKAGRAHIDVYGFAEDEVEFVNDEDEWIKNNLK